MVEPDVARATRTTLIVIFRRTSRRIAPSQGAGLRLWIVRDSGRSAERPPSARSPARNPASCMPLTRTRAASCSGRGASDRAARLGGVQWGSAADANNIYVAVSDVVAPGRGARFACRTRFRVRRAVRIRSRKRRRSFCAEGRERRHRVADTASAMCETRMQSRAICSGQRDSGRRFFGRRRWTPAGLFRRDGRIIWDVDTERDYKTVNGVKASAARSTNPGAVDRRWNSVREFGILLSGQRCRKRAAGIFSRRQVTAPAASASRAPRADHR